MDLKWTSSPSKEVLYSHKEFNFHLALSVCHEVFYFCKPSF
jgi:hypothetical protein